MTVVINPGVCEDCDDSDSHRVKCPSCNQQICPWCWHHIHGQFASADDFERIEAELDAAMSLLIAQTQKSPSDQ